MPTLDHDLGEYRTRVRIANGLNRYRCRFCLERLASTRLVRDRGVTLSAPLADADDGLCRAAAAVRGQPDILA
jgi:hypothetical protein